MASPAQGDARYRGASRATLSGIFDLFRRREIVGGLEASDRIDGRTCLVTGANRGLGKAVAIELARRGGRVVMACRSGHPGAAEEVRARSGSSEVEMAHLDLSDFASVEALAEGIKDTGRRIDIVVLNAGVVAARARRTVSGFEEMFQVNYLANFLLVTRLLENGSLAAGPPFELAGAGEAHSTLPVPRIIFVSSEVHRSAPPIDFAALGSFHEYGMKGAMTEYAVDKLLVSTFAVELSRRLERAGGLRGSVHHLCPGPINSDIAREAPSWTKPLLKLLFALLFRSPRRAAEPVLFLGCSRTIEGRTGIYLHLMSEKPPSAAAQDPEAGRLLWQASERLLRFGPPDC
jgi:NAD(P)-dependent dehydrogenase (short-subunit alcohol dehydrogenase family)